MTLLSNKNKISLKETEVRMVVAKDSELEKKGSHCSTYLKLLFGLPWWAAALTGEHDSKSLGQTRLDMTAMPSAYM